MSYHLFLSQLVLHYQDFVLEQSEILSPALAYVTLKYVLKFYKKKLAIKKMEVKRDSDLFKQLLVEELNNGSSTS